MSTSSDSEEFEKKYVYDNCHEEIEAQKKEQENHFERFASLNLINPWNIFIEKWNRYPERDKRILENL